MSSLAMAAKGRKFRAPCCAFCIFDDATICMALVIWAVLLTDLIRRRISRVLGMTRSSKCEVRSPKEAWRPHARALSRVAVLSGSRSLVGLLEFRCGSLQFSD